jgi:hypothetical protein
MSTLVLTLVLSGCMAVPGDPASPVPSAGASVERPVHGGSDVAGNALPPMLPLPSRPPRPGLIPPIRPLVTLPANPPRVEVRPTTGNGPVTARVAGTASWYCGHGSPCTHGYSGGLYAAAGPALRVGHWRGRYVDVVANGRLVRVQLIDWCACPRRTLDLYSSAFERLAPLSRGLVRVEVSW